MELNEALETLKNAGAEITESTWGFDEEVAKAKEKAQYAAFNLMQLTIWNKYGRNRGDKQISFYRIEKILAEIEKVLDELAQKSIEIMEVDE